MATKPSQYDQILEEQIKNNHEEVMSHIAQMQDDLNNRFSEMQAELEIIQCVIVNLDEETKTLIWLRAEELYKLKEYSKTNRKMVRAAFAQQSNGTKQQTQQPTRTSSGDTSIEIENLPAGQGVKCKRPGCNNYHRNADQVKTCYKKHYATA